MSLTSVIHNEFQQGSTEWMHARAGIPTASEFDSLISPKWEIRKGKTPETYLARKLAEFWLGGPLMGFSSFATEAGQILEGEAIPWYEFEHNQTVQRVGLVTNANGTVACSPDGLIGEEGGIEIKCPDPHTHVKYLLEGTVPDDYLAQVHGSLYVTGRAWWRFLSYRRHFPPLLVQVNRDEEIIEQIDEAVTGFLLKFERCKKLLEQLNKGPSEQRERMLVTLQQIRDKPVRFSWDEDAGEEPADLVP